MNIPKITEEQRQILKRKSVYALSTRPAEQGKKEADVKEAMFAPTEYLCDCIDGITDAANTALGEIETSVEDIKPTGYQTDEITTAIDHTFANNVIKTYTKNAQSVKITVPLDAKEGFYSGLMFFTGGEAPKVSVESNGKNVALMQYGTNVGEYNPSNNARVSMYVFSNDGINFDIFILEKV